MESLNCYTVYEHIAPNGKRYIGITRRKPEYRWNHGKAYNKNKHFYNSIIKYGWSNFKHNILFNNLSKEEAEEKERQLIQEFKTFDNKFGYNQDLGGNSRGKLGKEHLEKLSKSHTGIKWSEEARRNLSKSLKGRKISEEQKQKLRACRLGTKMSENQKQKISQKLKGRKFSQETIEKMKKSSKNKNIPKHVMEKLFESCKKRRKPVINIEQNIVYESLYQSSSVNHISKSRISECCRGVVYSYKGIHWYFYNIDNNAIIYPQKLINKWNNDKAKGRPPKWTNRQVPELYKKEMENESS